VAVVIDHGVLRVAVVDIVGSAVDSGAVREIGLVAFDGAVIAHPGPDRIGRAHRFGDLHACVPCHAGVDPAVDDAEEHDAVALHVVDRRVADLYIRVPGALRRVAEVSPAYQDAHPLISVPRGDAIHQYVVEVLIYAAGRDGDQSALFVLHLSAEHIMDG
jgi:hypothetical protein